MATEKNVVRVTKAQKFEVIKNFIPAEATHTFSGGEDKTSYVFDHDEMVAFLDKELGLLAKKNSKKENAEPTEAQKKNEEYKDLILDFLVGKEDGATCTDMMKGIPAFADFNTSKISSLTSALVKDERIVRKPPKKGRTPFVLA